MDIKDDIKSIIIRSGWSITELVTALHDKYGWSNSVSNFSNKLSKGTLRYKEALEIADVIGYTITWNLGFSKLDLDEILNEFEKQEIVRNINSGIPRGLQRGGPRNSGSHKRPQESKNTEQQQQNNTDTNKPPES